MANESSSAKRYFWYELRLKLSAICKKIKFDQWKGWIYLAPTMVLLLIFTVWPIFNTVRMSLLEGYSTMGEVGGRIYNFGIGLGYNEGWLRNQLSRHKARISDVFLMTVDDNGKTNVIKRELDNEN